MNQETFNQWSLLTQALVALFAIGFAWYQYKINKRLQDLQDYVAISIVPVVTENSPRLKLLNTGKLNLYLHKYEIDGNSQTYEKPRLLACAPETWFLLPVPNIASLEMPVRLYLKDDFEQKYITTGAAIIDAKQINVNQNIAATGTEPQLREQEQTIKQLLLQGNIRAWTYKTEKFDWKI